MQFGEVAPDLLKDYTVPHLFPDDYFDVLDTDQRPPLDGSLVGPRGLVHLGMLIQLLQVPGILFCVAVKGRCRN